MPVRARLVLASLLLSPVLTSLAAAQAVTFTGTDGNWHDPANWSSSLVPDALTDVLLDGGVDVVVDPAMGPLSAAVHDITIEGNARLTVRDGTTFASNHMVVRDGGRVAGISAIFTADEVDVQATAGGGSEPGYKWNPSSNDSRIIKITASTGYFLGGSTPASAAGVGAGFYANVHADDVELGGPVAIGLLYGFVPSPGQHFLLVEARSTRTGTFAGLPEGAIAADFGGVVLRISYLGGDGNDVVLTAEPGSVAVQPATWSAVKRAFLPGE